MNDELFERVLIQLQPELAQEFGYAILKDKRKLKALEIIKQEVIEFGYTHLDRLLEEKTYQEYINWCIDEETKEHYNKEQFDLLKEWSR